MSKPQKIAWEQRYSDDSGVQYAVRFDATKMTFEGESAIEFECGGCAEFPLSKLEWLIKCLIAIRDNT